jgi:hypothetical protein
MEARDDNVHPMLRIGLLPLLNTEQDPADMRALPVVRLFV